MGFPILVRRHLYIESGPSLFCTANAMIIAVLLDQICLEYFGFRTGSAIISRVNAQSPQLPYCAWIPGDTAKPRLFTDGMSSWSQFYVSGKRPINKSHGSGDGGSCYVDFGGCSPDSSVGWANVGPTSGRQYRRWPNVEPTYIVIWEWLWWSGVGLVDCDSCCW